ncbi:Hsp20/alpha crystallin family protein [Oxalobacteraceae bacterium OM1]|nr:Hsp20/alpha crystallin family protein [Oxalobacteraceae bacterium OM1]
MLYGSTYPRDIFAELNRLQRELEQSFDIEPSIRGIGRGGFPALNVGSTPQSVELYAFAPGLDPAKIEVNLERGVLTIAGERTDQPGTPAQQATVHLNERFHGRFKRVVSLPDDVDPDGVSAVYQNGVLHISVRRQQAAQPRRIDVH